MNMNPDWNVAIEILKYILPSVVVLLACNSIVKKFVTTETQKAQIDLMRDTQETSLRLRLQAYERLSILIERINTQNLITRIYQTGMTVRDLQYAAITSINAEFEHNLSQQIYVTPQLWNMIRNVKDQEINMINQIATQIKAEDNARELHKRIVDYVLTTEALPTEMALKSLNDEAKRVLSYGSM